MLLLEYRYFSDFNELIPEFIEIGKIFQLMKRKV